MITHSSLETEKLGEKLAKDIKKGGVIALYGELGAGKTTFTKGLARGLGIKNRIISPTFIFIRSYIVNQQLAINNPPRQTRSSGEAGQQFFYHIDLYRIDRLEDAHSLGLEEILSDSRNIVVIEWPEKIKKLLPKKRIEVYFKYLDKGQREIKIKIL
ncbi:tRNA (adenosine(37)-N6)-threonylcarbamoyltransferase complex ATPase subunit type 1 TsaE [Candidatus Microgenomates bacterium]|nr:tRNA (adenosine(37)-N6)-threonylcarbamoyltransferase complex ATPase subunit type 1 TsaE [Candidatus Microgenomates bacterium]